MIRFSITGNPAQLSCDDNGQYVFFSDADKIIKELEKKLSSVKPMCPYCKTEMFIAKFNGYYDTFQHWDCKCSGDFPDKVKPENVCQGMYN
jgi:hypothetical protein